MKILKTLLIFLIGLTVLSGCKKADNEAKIIGTVNYKSTGIYQATIEIYLKSGRDKSIPPFMTAATDESGKFELTLPSGRYFIIGKKRFMEGGITKMLVGEYPKNPVDAEGGSKVTISPFSLFNMGEDKRLDIEGAGIKGKVSKAGSSVAGSYVYVYPESNPNMIGPSYVISSEVGEDGSFKMNLLPGKYYIAVRQRSNRTKLGYLNLGDFSVDFEGNPIIVKQDEYFGLGSLTLHEVDEKKLDGIKKDEAALAFGVKITGKVINEDDEPVRGIYVYAYEDPKMVGKPQSISKKTDSQGIYTLYLAYDESSTKNQYYIGARTNFGGPLEPGESVGTYNENPEHLITISDEELLSGINITVKEVW